MSGNKIVWEKEWSSDDMKTVPNHALLTPSNEVVLFRNYLNSLGIIPPKTLIDIGSGKGRNSIYMAKEGFQVYGIEYISTAVEYSKSYVLKSEMQEFPKFILGDVTKRWKFKSNFFDLAIDSLTTVGLQKNEREKCRNEMYRTLKKGGIALIRVVSSDDKLEMELMKKYPGGEPNSSLWPDINKFQKNFSEIELREFYQDFNILVLKKLKKKALKLGRVFTATNWWLIIQKP